MSHSPFATPCSSRLLVAIAGVATATAVGCVYPLDVDGGGGDRVVGSGIARTETRVVEGFSGVQIGGIGSLTIEVTGEEHLTITADDNVLPLLRSEVVSGRLVLGPREGVNLEDILPIEYRLEVRTLVEIDASGVTVVDASGIDTERLDVTLSGVTELRARGSAEHQEVVISGVGRYDGGELLGAVASIDISGASFALVNVSDLLDVSVSGASIVEYLGNPEVHASVSGAGVVRARR